MKAAEHDFAIGTMLGKVTVHRLDHATQVIVAIKISVTTTFTELLRVSLWPRSRVYLRQAGKPLANHPAIEWHAQRLLLDQKFIENFPDVRDAFWAWRSKTMPPPT